MSQLQDTRSSEADNTRPVKLQTLLAGYLLIPLKTFSSLTAPLLVPFVYQVLTGARKRIKE